LDARVYTRESGDTRGGPLEENAMNRWRKLLIGATPLVVIAGSVGAQASKSPVAKAAATKAQSAQAPKLEVDMLWPMPMPNRWILGSAVGVAVDARDHVF